MAVMGAAMPNEYSLYPGSDAYRQPELREASHGKFAS
jgi:hypothetical protein